MGCYAIVKALYRRVLPPSLRRMNEDPRSLTYWIVAPIKHLLQKYAEHDEIYDRGYYEELVEPSIRKSATVMARSIRDEFRPATVIDVGCGTGELLAMLRELGISGVGFERSKAALEFARSKGVNVRELDLEQPIDRLPVERADLVVSTEVAEHLPEEYADTFVELLCRTAETVLITAATPGQGGTDHVNEQPRDYWIEKFAQRGQMYQEELTERLRREWDASGVESFYASNLLLFRRQSGPAEHQRG
jgi:SAM-dependent methyltransferase